MNRRQFTSFCLLCTPVAGFAAANQARARGVRIIHGVVGLLRPEGWVAGRLWRKLMQSEGHDLVMVEEAETGKHGFIDIEGKVRIPFEWEDAGWFSDGLAPVCKAGKWGLLDPSGDLKTPLKWDQALTLNNGLCPVQQGGKWGYINSQGDVVIEPAWDEAKIFPTPNGLARVRSGEKWGFIDQTGKEVIPPAYEQTRPFYGAATFVKTKGETRWRCIDRTGKLLSKESWSFCWGFPFVRQQRLAAVELEKGKMACIDETGAYALPPVFEWIGEFDQGRAIAKKEGKLRIIDDKGADVILGDWDNLRESEHGFAISEKDGLEGYVEMATGREIKPQWERVDSFGLDYGVAYHQNRIALISKDGEVAGRWFDRPINTNWRTKAEDAYPALKRRK